jgi:hypothetical protein
MLGVRSPRWTRSAEGATTKVRSRHAAFIRGFASPELTRPFWSSPVVRAVRARGVVVAQVRSGAPGTRERRARALRPECLRAPAPHRAVRASLAQIGDVLAKMARDEGLEVSRVSKAFGNDILLALSCREAGCTRHGQRARLRPIRGSSRSSSSCPGRSTIRQRIGINPDPSMGPASVMTWQEDALATV